MCFFAHFELTLIMTEDLLGAPIVWEESKSDASVMR